MSAVLLDGAPDPAGAEAALAYTLDWLRTFRSAAGASHGVREALEGTAESLEWHLRTAGLEPWAERVRGLGDPGAGEDNNTTRAGRSLLWSAGVSLAAEAEHPDLFTVAEDLFLLCPRDRGRPGRAIAAAAGSRAGERYAVALTTRATRVAERMRFVDPETRNVVGPVNPATERRLWPFGHDVYVGDSWAWDALRWIDPTIFMSALQRLPRPVAYGIMQALGSLSVEEVTGLLESAPPAFDATGALTSGGAAFAAVEAASETLRDGRSVPVGEFVAAAEQVISSLTKREDVQHLGRAWLQHLVWESRSRGYWRERPLPELALRLSAQLQPLAEPLVWIAAEEDLWRADRVLAETAVLGSADRDVEAAELMAEAIKRELVSSTGRDVPLGGDLEALIVGSILASHPEPVAWFEALWEETYTIRERLRIGHHSKLDNPGHVTVAWAAHGVNYLLGRGAEPAGLWKAVRDAVLETVWMDQLHGLEHFMWRTASGVGVLGAALVDKNQLDQEALDRWLAGLLEPNLEFAVVLADALLSSPQNPLLRAGRTLHADRVRGALERGMRPLASGATDRALTPARRDALDRYSNAL